MKRVIRDWRFQGVERFVKMITNWLGAKSMRQAAGHSFTLLLIIVAGFVVSCDDDDKVEPWQPEMEKLRAAITPYDHIEHAHHDGYTNEVTGYRSQMGFHYLNVPLLDNKFEVEKPELLLYAPDENNDLKFVAVEYAVPIEDLNNPHPFRKVSRARRMSGKLIQSLSYGPFTSGSNLTIHTASLPRTTLC